MTNTELKVENLKLKAKLNEMDNKYTRSLKVTLCYSAFMIIILTIQLIIL